MVHPGVEACPAPHGLLVLYGKRIAALYTGKVIDDLGRAVLRLHEKKRVHSSSIDFGTLKSVNHHDKQQNQEEQKRRREVGRRMLPEARFFHGVRPCTGKRRCEISLRIFSGVSGFIRYPLQ